LENGIAALEDVKSVCKGLSPDESRALERAIAERCYVYGSYLLASGFRNESRIQLANALQRHPAHLRAWIKLGLSWLPSGAFRRMTELRRRFA
jgi:hypothetical protein